MIAKRELTKNYRMWNSKWKSPYGLKYSLIIFNIKVTIDFLYLRYNKFLNNLTITKKLLGMFAFQDNSSTRIVEYPWAFLSTPLESGMNAVEIGGGLSGFQFVLSKCGLNVTNIDPGDPTHNWNCTAQQIEVMNKAFGTNVKFIPNSISKANLEIGSIDRIFCISVMEHLNLHDRKEIIKNSYKSLKTGGYLIMSVDLFLDLFPFSSKSRNKWGKNISIRDLVSYPNFEMVNGVKGELCGFKEFECSNVLGELSNLFLSKDWPVLAQLFILKKVR